jgi:ribosomal protein S18 acetylase RimI-like enzyme
LEQTFGIEMSMWRKEAQTRDFSTASMHEVHLRPARASDKDFAISLRLDGASSRLATLGPVDERSLRARFKKNYCRDRSTIICLDGKDVGWIQVLEAEDRIEIEQLHFVAPYRNRGLGRMLIEDIFAYARASGRVVKLSVIRGNRAIRLYLRLGFRLVGEDAEKFNLRWEADGRQKGKRRKAPHDP